MPTATTKVAMPALARLILSELADRCGKRDEDLLVELIHRAAVDELGRERQVLHSEEVVVTAS